jgi:Protein of unknown function (DUF3370)
MMWFLFPVIPVETSQISSQEIVQIDEVRSLPGQLNKIPVFNSNSPELVLGEGILLSTFNQENKADQNAHLNFTFQGRFDLFAHHVAKKTTENDLRTLYLGILINNPTDKNVTVDILQGASYLSQPDAPFIDLPSLIEGNNIYSGPGSRVMGDILQGKHQQSFPNQLTILPGESKMLVNLPIPVQELIPPLNGRSTYLKLFSDGPVYVASLAKYSNENDISPSLEDWKKLLEKGSLSNPRDLAPTPPNSPGKIIYGRVSGVSQGNLWKADLVDSPNSNTLTIPNSNHSISYPLSSLIGGTLGTKQIQTAPMLVRYPDTAYSAHGNYGVQYSLTLPLFNPEQEAKTVKLRISTPLKQDKIEFLETPGPQIFFRGLVQIKYNDEQNIPRLKYFHLVQKRGEKGQDLVTLIMPPHSRKLVSVELIYPPDATPPQILTVETE